MIKIEVEKHYLYLIEADIALQEVDAVVNAANKSLILGGGVAGAIRKFGGSSIQEECNRIGPIDVGAAVITSGGKLKAKYVIHAVGPVYGEGDEEIKLARATHNSLKIAERKNFKRIAFPAISTGIYRFPIRRCSEIMLKTVLDFLRKNPFPEEVLFCLFDSSALNVFKETLERLISDGFDSHRKKKKQKA